MKSSPWAALHILGTERHEARRIDNQLRGRAGRQGDPGSSRFFLSLEDDLLRIFGGENVKAMMHWLGMTEGVPIESKLISKRIENAQKAVEAQNFEARKHLLEYDDVMNKQRETIYSLRRVVPRRRRPKGIRPRRGRRDRARSRRHLLPARAASRPVEHHAIRERNPESIRNRLEDGRNRPRQHESRSNLADTLVEKVIARYDEKEKLFGGADDALARTPHSSRYRRWPVERPPAHSRPFEGRHWPSRLRTERIRSSSSRKKPSRYSKT